MKYLRIKKKKDFERILKSGKHTAAKSLKIVYLPAEQVRMAVCVGKKFGKSVQRNALKRLLRESFRTYADRMKPISILLIPRVGEEYSYAVFTKDIGKLLAKEKLLED